MVHHRHPNRSDTVRSYININATRNAAIEWITIGITGNRPPILQSPARSSPFRRKSERKGMTIDERHILYGMKNRSRLKAHSVLLRGCPLIFLMGINTYFTRLSSHDHTANQHNFVNSTCDLPSELGQRSPRPIASRDRIPTSRISEADTKATAAEGRQ